ncbi:MAG: hypothetical protein QF595_00415 [Dehalococcoidia bacterium]|nr:hypothetical protein [Dehalococcoidia bacterium]
MDRSRLLALRERGSFHQKSRINLQTRLGPLLEFQEGLSRPGLVISGKKSQGAYKWGRQWHCALNMSISVTYMRDRCAYVVDFTLYPVESTASGRQGPEVQILSPRPFNACV